MTTREFIIGNCTIIVRRPELSEAERAKREKRAQMALQQAGRSMQKKPVEGKRYA